MIRGAASAGSLAYEEPATAEVCLEVLTIPGGLTKGSLIEGRISRESLPKPVMRARPPARTAPSSRPHSADCLTHGADHAPLEHACQTTV
jgi:hypothetical protein